MKRVLFLALWCVCFATLAMAQPNQSMTDDGNEMVSEEDRADIFLEPSEGEAYNMWSDPLYYQFERMMPELAQSIGRLDSRIATLAVTDLDFSPSLDGAFRKVASAKLYGQLLIENPKLKLIKCDECNMVRSEIKNGILTVSRGMATKEDRKNLAKKIGVQGFMSAMIIEDKRQLTIVVNVYDADEGRIILSDVVTGVPVAETTYWNFYAGQLVLPVLLNTDSSGDTDETVSQSAILLGAEYSKRFSESWMLSTSFGLYADNNSKLENKEQFSAGLMFDGTVGWEMASFMNNDVSFILTGGIGQFISPQFNFSIYGKLGFKVIVNKMLTFNLYGLSLGKTNLKTAETGVEPSQLTGSGYSIAFGFQF